MSKIDEVLSRISDKKTRERAIAASSIHIEYLETPVPSMNKALNGGFAYGRQVMFYGNKSSGKSSVTLQMVAQAQKDGKACVWFDAEKTFDPAWARRLGVNTDELLVVQVSDASRMTHDVVEFMKAGVDVVVIDSISSIVPMAYYEKDSLDLKGLEASRQIGTQSKDLGAMVSMFNAANEGTLLILISQVRNNLSGMYAMAKPTGGYAPLFFSTTVVKLWSSESMKNAKEGEVQHGDYLGTELIGREVTWTIENNKTGKPFVQGSYDFYFDGPFVGVDTVADLIDEAARYGVIRKGGAWYNYGELKWQGRDKVIEHFRALPDDVEILKKEVAEYAT